MMLAGLVKTFLEVLNMSITASYILLFVCLLRLLLKRMPKAISCGLWAVVFFRLVCPVSFSSRLSLLGLLTHWIVPAAGNGLTFIPESTGSTAAVPNAAVTATGSVPAALPDAANTFPGTILLVEAAAIFWLLGLAAIIVYTIWSCIRLQRSLADATRASGRIYETDAVSSPFVFGFFRPKIFLPVGLDQADAALVLQHEQAHIQRMDHLVKPAAFLVVAVHWFNPFVWLAYFLLGQDMEMSCDEHVMKHLDHEARQAYSGALFRLALNRRVIVGSPLAFGENKTGSRIKNILNYREPVLRVTLAVVAVAAIAAIFLLANPIFENQNLEKSTFDPATLSADVQLLIPNPVLAPETGKIALTLKNNSDIRYLYGRFTALEKQVDQIWYSVPTKKDVYWTMEAFSLEPWSQADLEFDLDYFYGRLKPGRYRLVKDINSYDPPGQTTYAIADFTVAAAAGTDTLPATGTSAVTSAVTSADPVTGYLFVADYLLAEKNVSSPRFKYLAVDTTQLTDLTAGEKERFLRSLAQYDLQVMDTTLDGLLAAGYIPAAGGEFTDGALIKFEKVRRHGATITMDAWIYLAGLNGFGLVDFDITSSGGSWSITRTDVSWVS